MIRYTQDRSLSACHEQSERKEVEPNKTPQTCRPSWPSGVGFAATAIAGGTPPDVAAARGLRGPPKTKIAMLQRTAAGGPTVLALPITELPPEAWVVVMFTVYVHWHQGAIPPPPSPCIMVHHASWCVLRQCPRATAFATSKHPGKWTPPPPPHQTHNCTPKDMHPRRRSSRQEPRPAQRKVIRHPDPNTAISRTWKGSVKRKTSRRRHEDCPGGG